MRPLILIATLLSTTFFVACNKAPGEGGTSSITGKVMVYDINNDGDTTSTIYAGMDVDVHIIYGEENQTYSDRFATSLDGSYTFSNLTPGKYTVFAYSQCNTCLGGMDVVKKTVEVTDKKQEVVVEDLVILD